MVVDGARSGIGSTALTVPVPGERSRFVIVLPQRNGLVYIGLTDEPFDGPVPDEPVAPPADVEFLLRVASSVLDRPLTGDDVLGSYAGLRPLLEGTGRSADLSRRHAVLTAPNGVLTIVGGKLTTYRKMAQDAVDAAVAAAALTAGPSTTRDLPLVGAGTRHHLSTVDASARLVASYGTEAPRVAALASFDPDLGAPIGRAHGDHRGRGGVGGPPRGRPGRRRRPAPPHAARPGPATRGRGARPGDRPGEPHPRRPRPGHLNEPSRPPETR